MIDEEPRHNGRTAAELASDAENSLRGIVHLCEADERPLTAHDAYRTLSGLTRMLEHLPEAVTRLRALLQTQNQAGQLTMRSGPYAGDPDAALAVMAEAVDDFVAHYGPALTSLDRAQGAVSELGSQR